MEKSIECRLYLMGNRETVIYRWSNNRRSCCLKVEEVDKCYMLWWCKQIYYDHLLTLSTPHHQHRYYQQRRKERGNKVPFITFFANVVHRRFYSCFGKLVYCASWLPKVTAIYILYSVYRLAQNLDSFKWVSHLCTIIKKDKKRFKEE